MGIQENLANWQRVFDFANGAGVDNLLLANRGSSNEAEWSIRRNSASQSLVVQNFWTLDEWQHVVATVDASGVMKLYRNAELKGSMLGHLPRSITRNSQYIGRSNWANDAFFMGKIDDFRLYDRALTIQEVEQIHDGDLRKTVILGGEDPTVTIYWGDEDPGETTEVNASSSDAWDYRVDLGVLETGSFVHKLEGLAENSAFFYRLTAENAAGLAWATEAGAFATGKFDFLPSSIAGGELLLWLDSSDVNGDYNRSNEPFGGFVDQWRDKSGASRHAGNGNGPSLLVNGVEFIEYLEIRWVFTVFTGTRIQSF